MAANKRSCTAESSDAEEAASQKRARSDTQDRHGCLVVREVPSDHMMEMPEMYYECPAGIVLNTIWSTGDWGIEHAALTSARDTHFSTKGFCPYYYKTCRGINLGLERFGLVSCTFAAPRFYRNLPRTFTREAVIEENITQSQGTLLIVPKHVSTDAHHVANYALVQRANGYPMSPCKYALRTFARETHTPFRPLFVIFDNLAIYEPYEDNIEFYHLVQRFYLYLKVFEIQSLYVTGPSAVIDTPLSRRAYRLFLRLFAIMKQMMYIKRFFKVDERDINRILVHVTKGNTCRVAGGFIFIFFLDVLDSIQNEKIQLWRGEDYSTVKTLVFTNFTVHPSQKESTQKETPSTSKEPATCVLVSNGTSAQTAIEIT